MYFLSRIKAPAKRFGHTLTNQWAEQIIPYTYQELFLLALFGSRHKQRAPGQQRRKTSLSSSSMDIPAWKITLTPVTHNKKQHCGLLPTTVTHLLQTREPTYYLSHQKEPFLTLSQV